MRDSGKVAVLGAVTAVAVVLTLSSSGPGSDASAQGGTVPAASRPTAGPVPSAGPSTAPVPSAGASPVPSAAPTPSSTAAAAGRDAADVPDRDVADSATAVVQAASGRTTVVPGGTSPAGPGRVQRYTVAVEDGLGVDAAQFAREVDATLADPRSWRHTGQISFQRVDAGPVDVRVVLASPATTDRMCRPLSTNGIYSCGNGPTAVINAMRWLRGADAYAGHLALYRQYVINHEVGHTIGHGHAQCPAPGELAPVMMQQTIGIGKCVASPWPFP